MPANEKKRVKTVFYLMFTITLDPAGEKTLTQEGQMDYMFNAMKALTSVAMDTNKRLICPTVSVIELTKRAIPHIHGMIQIVGFNAGTVLRKFKKWCMVELKNNYQYLGYFKVEEVRNLMNVYQYMAKDVPSMKKLLLDTCLVNTEPYLMNGLNNPFKVGFLIAINEAYTKYFKESETTGILPID